MSSYKVVVYTFGDTKGTSNALRFATEDEARTYARDLFSRWTAVREYSVEESGREPNYRIVDGKLEAIPGGGERVSVGNGGCTGCGMPDPCGHHYEDCTLLEPGDIVLPRLYEPSVPVSELRALVSFWKGWRYRSDDMRQLGEEFTRELEALIAKHDPEGKA